MPASLQLIWERLQNQPSKAKCLGIERCVHGCAVIAKGRFQAASGGVLFLDEIGNLAMGGQTKLLTAFRATRSHTGRRRQTRERSMLGSSVLPISRKSAYSIPACSTDLLFRLNTIVLRVPLCANDAKIFQNCYNIICTTSSNSINARTKGVSRSTPRAHAFRMAWQCTLA